MHRGAEKLRYRGTTIHKRRRADPLKPETGSARRETAKDMIIMNIHKIILNDIYH
jgi:hypothetical protein